MSYWFHFWYVGDLNKTDATVPSMHHPAPTLLTLDPSLPSNLASELADQNPGISVLTVRKRKSWAVYAVHTDIPKSLTMPFRKVDKIVDSVRNWLKQALPFSASLATATPAPHADEAPDFATPQIQTDESSVATTHVVEFLHAHPDLSDLEVSVGDGIYMLTATHARTMYTIERCYTSWHLAKQDLLRWIQKLDSQNTTATAPPTRDHGLRSSLHDSAPISYKGCIKPTALGRVAGPGRPRTATPSMAQQMGDTLQNKCKKLEAKLATLQSENSRLTQRCRRLAAQAAN